MPNQNSQLPNSMQYLLDGGSLLHGVLFDTGQTWEEICNSFSRSLSKKYGHAIVIFDGYQSGPATEDAVHARSIDGPGTTV